MDAEFTSQLSHGHPCVGFEQSERSSEHPGVKRLFEIHEEFLSLAGG
jgi:hypothetical protein